MGDVTVVLTSGRWEKIPPGSSGNVIFQHDGSGDDIRVQMEAHPFSNVSGPLDFTLKAGGSFSFSLNSSLPPEKYPYSASGDGGQDGGIEIGT